MCSSLSTLYSLLSTLHCSPYQRIRRHALAAVLGPEAEEHDVARAALDVDERGFAVQLPAAEEPTGEQRIPARRIGRDRGGLRAVDDFERRTFLEPDRRHVRDEAPCDGMIAANVDGEDRAR